MDGGDTICYSIFVSAIGIVGAVMFIRSSTRINSLVTTCLTGRSVRIAMRPHNSRTRRAVLQRGPSLILLSVVLPNGSNVAVYHSLHTG